VDYLSKLPKRHGSGGSDGRCWNKVAQCMWKNRMAVLCEDIGGEGVRTVKNKTAATIVVK